MTKLDKRLKKKNVNKIKRNKDYEHFDPALLLLWLGLMILIGLLIYGLIMTR